MSLTTINEPDFSFSFPEGEWTNHSTNESYESRCGGDREQIIVARYRARSAFAQSELQPAVMKLIRAQLDVAQKISANSCQFESGKCNESPGRFDATVFGHDLCQVF